MARPGRHRLIVEEIHTPPATSHWITQALAGIAPDPLQAWCYACHGLQPLTDPRETAPGLVEGTCGTCAAPVYRVGAPKSA